jgi:phosphoribosyl 1,2-cyclic phosphodiesterase
VTVEVVVIASGSSGNSMLVRSGDSALLVDAGVSALQIRSRLSSFECSVDELSAIVITHEHSDHVRGLDVLLKRNAVPVWATAGTWSQLPVRATGGGEISSGRQLVVGDFCLTPVATSHDACEPVALFVDDGRHRMAMCTDTGVFTGLLEQRMAGCHVLLLEANHDADMLRNGRYPWPLKQRIASRLGHLANHQTAEAVDRLRWDQLRAVVGLHLSAENNLPELALETLNQCVSSSLPVQVVPRSDMLRVSIDDDRVSFERRSVPPPARPGRR